MMYVLIKSKVLKKLETALQRLKPFIISLLLILPLYSVLMAKGNKIKWLGKWMLRLFLFFFVFTLTPVVLYKFFSPSITPLMFLRALAMKTSGDTIHLSYKWIPIDDMSPYLYRAAIAAEDDHFMTHHGFNFGAMEQALESNEKNEKFIKGGSTISQQTSKNVFLWPNRDYLRKGLEAWFTILTEQLWGKKRIMEVYLNVVELGDGVFGVEAASMKYFKKHASQLNQWEAASLIAVFPNPHIYKVIKPSPYTQRYRNAIVYRMGMLPKVEFK
ncbi:MAG: monofunctional biosynthetic peptidoglycan transglycosylase [Bacteroidales bacterium]